MKPLLLVFAWVLLLTGPAGASTINLVTDFPDHQGDNGLYAKAYNFSTNTYRNLDEHPSPDPGSGYPANYFQYSFYTPTTSNNNPFLQLGYVDYHDVVAAFPSNTEDAVMAWQAPGPGTATITVTFDPLYNGYTNVYIKQNDTLLKGTGFAPQEIFHPTPVTFNLTNVKLAAGDFLYFGINWAGDYEGDLILLSGTIEVVPLPGALWLLGSGLLGLVGWSRFGKS